MHTLVLALPVLFLVSTASAQTPQLAPHGHHADDQFGAALCVTDDLDGDGVPDLLIGAPALPGSFSAPGYARVVSGADGALIYRFETGAVPDLFGASVAASFDVDGDGLRDLLVGQPGTGPGIAKPEVRLFASATGFFFGNFIVDTGDSWNAFGHSLADVGDVNGDGKSDVAIGVPSLSNDRAGFVRLAWGFLAQHEDITGDEVGDHFGFAVAGVGDIDLDGVPDVLAGAPAADYARVFSGSDGSTLLTVPGAGGEFAAATSAAGDFDGDGVPDFALGVPLFDQVKVISGADGQLLRQFSKASPEFGRAIAPLGDVNGDLVPDLLIGAPGDLVLDMEGAGTAYVVSGNNGQLLFNFAGHSAGARLGASAAAADLDGDGRPEMLLGEPGNLSPNGTATGSAGVYAGELAGSIVHYGIGCQGSFLITPRLDVFGDPLPGGELTLAISEALGGAPAAVLLGTGTMDLPLANGCIVWGNPLVLSIAVVLDGDFPGNGSKVLVGHLPGDTPVGLFFSLQALILDDGTEGGVSGTSAYAVTVQ
jgi:FG-GAP-like repeat/FG-GAP repeat